ncbi:hypothetical protein BU26DRAFT_571656 [Trematosphaeria pertusa]|uniref:Uncharacterized protein n=1 Tax=Trematosphaeria pertusa TaxID=390896 RepID=A0A6A6HUA4_9PLEO|nr:uncharacterized protein BU26DRAFT_571656 [Trematosphaeria pertusa]KAF2241499.1 hypothetical protein BU26DRAFT_571656 [Trematosphaeria pertusa]
MASAQFDVMNLGVEGFSTAPSMLVPFRYSVSNSKVAPLAAFSQLPTITMHAFAFLPMFFAPSTIDVAEFASELYRNCYHPRYKNARIRDLLYRLKYILNRYMQDISFVLIAKTSYVRFKEFGRVRLYSFDANKAQKLVNKYRANMTPQSL